MFINFTKEALHHIETVRTDEQKDHYLRLDIKKTGCSGFAYVVDFVDEATDCDTIFNFSNTKIVVRNEIFPVLYGTKIDYGREEGSLNEGFIFSNPNIKSECGCGESFSI